MELPDWLTQVFIGSASGIAVGFGLFKFLGENWIKHRFAKDLEQAKSEISLHVAERMKIYDKEYEVLPKIWKKLVAVKKAIRSAKAMYEFGLEFDDFEYEDIQKYDTSSWINEEKLNPYEKKIFSSTPDKNMAECQIIYYRKAFNAQKAYKEFK